MPSRDMVCNAIKKRVYAKRKLKVLEHVSTVVDGMSRIPRLEIDATRHDNVIVWFNMTGKNLRVTLRSELAKIGKVQVYKKHAFLFVAKGTVPAKTYDYGLSWAEKPGVWNACEGRHSDPELIVR